MLGYALVRSGGCTGDGRRWFDIDRGEYVGQNSLATQLYHTGDAAPRVGRVATTMSLMSPRFGPDHQVPRIGCSLRRGEVSGLSVD